MSPAVSVLRQIDQLCDHFEEQWLAGRSPLLEDYLRGISEPKRSDLLAALLKVELELSTRAGRVARRENYLQRFPHDRGVIERVFHESREPSAVSQELPPTISNVSAQPIKDDSPSATVRLRVIAGPHEGQEFTFREHDTLIAGRATAAQLRLGSDRHFSRHHFRLEVNPPVCFLTDLGSRNGTFVNGQRVSEHHLKHGDIISGGRTQIEVSIVEPSPPPTKPPLPTVSMPAAKAPAEGPSGEIPGYDLMEVLGRGGLGVVYRARQRATQRECALKVMQPAHKTSEKALQMFLREASLLSQLAHPHIVRFLEMGSAGGRLFFAMEYVPRIDLNALLRSRPLADRVRIACGLMCQVLDALEYAHGRSLVHRDVKPANILTGRSGRKLTAKLADFGLAKVYSNAGFSQITRDGDVCGSLNYMAPEQLISSRDARPACDIYSAGATLYKLLSGKDPRDLEKSRCKFLSVLEDPPIPLDQRCPQLPAELVAVVHRALSRVPEDRFATASAMRQAVLSFAR